MPRLRREVDRLRPDQVPPLSAWRWLRRGCGYGPLIGGLSSLLTVPEWIPLLLVFPLMIAVPFGIVCRLVIGSDPAGGGLVVAAGLIPFVLLNISFAGMAPLAEGVVARAFLLSVLAAVGCAATTALLIRRDDRAVQRAATGIR